MARRGVTWQRVAEIARELPEIEETTSWGKPSFAVRGKKFAGLSTRHEGAMWTRCDREERPLLVASNPDAYRLTPHFEASPAFSSWSGSSTSTRRRCASG